MGRRSSRHLQCSPVLLPPCTAHHRGHRVTHLPLLKHPEASDSLSMLGVGHIPPCPPGKPSVLRSRCRQEEPIRRDKPGVLGAEALVPCPIAGPEIHMGHSSLLFPGMQQGVKRAASHWVCFSCSLTCSVLLEADPTMEKPGLVQKHKQASPLKPV